VACSRRSACTCRQRRASLSLHPIAHLVKDVFIAVYWSFKKVRRCTSSICDAPSGMNVVWIKRDARFIDHEPLSLAAADKLPCIVLYIYEPEHLQSATYHESHHIFINQGLSELDAKLRASAVGGDGGLTVRSGDAVDVLEALHNSLPIRKLFSHHEVGNCISLRRNEKIAAWAAASGVSWTQCRQDGASDRRHEELDEGSWAGKWTQQMLHPQHPPPACLLFVSSQVLPRGGVVDAAACGVTHRGVRPSAQTGGEAAAHSILRSFLERRGEGYCDELSSPLSGWDSCSRISPCAQQCLCICCIISTALAGTCPGVTYRYAPCSKR
jgi:deoxyribodipyrimidine photo-lyase